MVLRCKDASAVNPGIFMVFILTLLSVGYVQQSMYGDSLMTRNKNAPVTSIKNLRIGHSHVSSIPARNYSTWVEGNPEVGSHIPSIYMLFYSKA